MQLTLNIPNEQLYNQIVWLLKRFKNDGLEMIIDKKENSSPNAKNLKDGLDFSSFKVDAFKSIDGVEYQKKMRDEW
jgi:hypothetical protein